MPPAVNRAAVSTTAPKYGRAFDAIFSIRGVALGVRVCSRRPKQGVWNSQTTVPDPFFRPSGTDRTKVSGTLKPQFQTPFFGLLEQTLTSLPCALLSGS